MGDLSDKHNKVELLDLDTWRWERRAEYPFETTIYDARTVHYNQQFYLFGGKKRSSSRLSRIAAYNPTTDQWFDKGQLLTARSSSGVIWDENGFLIVGGWIYYVKSEKCLFNGDQLECSYYGPIIDQLCKYH